MPGRFTILGSSGFVGSDLADHLSQQGHDPFLPGRGDPRIFAEELGHVIYCIGLTADYQKRPFDTVEAHVGVLARLLERASFDSVVYLSSTRLYDWGGPFALETDDLPLNPTHPRHLYDLSKSLGEWLCLNASGGRGRVARLACVYSESLSGDNFLHAVIARARRERRVQLQTALAFERDYVHVRDVSRALFDIATRGKRPIYNVASGFNLSNRDLFSLIERQNGCRVEALLPDPSPAPTVPRISVEALKDDFGLSPGTVADNIARLLPASE